MEEVKESIVTDIVLPSLEVSLKQELQSTQTWESFEPFILPRLPYIIRDTNRELYEPRVVSIGPYHRGKESLLGMEAHKKRCLIDFLKQNTKVGLEVYVKEIKALEARARNCYSESIKMNEDEFTEMLLLDGCFMLEFFLKIRVRESHLLLDVGWGTQTIISDLLLFENQIPFFVIETLYYIVTSYKEDRETLLHLLHPYSIAPDLQTSGQIYHLLHLYYKWFIPGRISQINSVLSSDSISSRSRSRLRISSSESSRSDSKLHAWLNSRCMTTSAKPYKIPMRSIPCATELYEAGITFKKKKNPTDVFNITFENGVMEIPTIMIDPSKRMFHMNLAAFERSNSSMEQELMSYVALLDCLIKTKNDVALLQRCEIINSMIMNEEEVAAFFNQIGDWSTLDPDEHYFAPLFKHIQSYCNSRWHKHRARLMHDYFNNPWSILSVFAAIFLIMLSGLQTVYQMYPVVHPGHPS
ncbi:hypothetical protein LUZ60_016018 [Juncus effusus]|nr:hypothetical protein LUZ60_016018 [Juncus effusus]